MTSRHVQTFLFLCNFSIPLIKDFVLTCKKSQQRNASLSHNTVKCGLNLIFQGAGLTVTLFFKGAGLTRVCLILRQDLNKALSSFI